MEKNKTKTFLFELNSAVGDLRGKKEGVVNKKVQESQPYLCYIMQLQWFFVF